MNPPFYFGPAYKYCAAATLPLIVANQKIWFSRADTFNDAFELSPFLIPLEWDNIVKLSETDFATAKSLADTAFTRVCSSLYITCFSKHYLAKESQLMWAHYGDNHKGCCFCIDFTSLKDDRAAGMYPIEVQYTESLLDERSKRTVDSDDLPLLLGGYKSDVWEYEQEVRLVLESESFHSTKFDYINDRKNVAVTLNPTSISKVVFGLKSTPEDCNPVVKSFCEIGHLPDFTRLDIDPITLDVIERDTGIKEMILEHNK
jgi:hypothetical protein